MVDSSQEQTKVRGGQMEALRLQPGSALPVLAPGLELRRVLAGLELRLPLGGSTAAGLPREVLLEPG